MTTSNASAAENNAQSYASLTEMRATYNNLVREYAKTLNGETKGDPSAELLDEMEDFVARGRGTGTLLDDPDERWEAQNMLNFWAKILYRYNRAPGDEPPATTLAPFGIPESPRVAATTTIVFQAPPDPPDVYVGRASFISDVRQQLANGRNIALCGPPGIGKTLIAQKLAHDSELRKKYPDGVLWARVGEQPDVSSILRTWSEALQISSRETDSYIDVEHVAKVIRQALGRRQMLLVIDDAWQSNIGTALKLGGSQCVHILTTCFMSVALDFDVQGAVTVPGFSESDGVRLIERQVPNAINGQEEQIKALVKSVDNSPLALALFANYRKLQIPHGPAPDLNELRSRLLEEKRVIEAEQPSIPFKDSCEVRTPAGLLATIGWCFDQLGSEEKHVLRAFSFFPPKPNSFSDTVAKHATDGHNERLQMLLDYGLLERVSFDRYSLHRAVSDFLKRRPYLGENTPEQRMAAFVVALFKDPATDSSVLEQEEANILAALDMVYHYGMWQLVVDGTTALFKYFDQQGLYALAKKNLYRAREAAQKLNDEPALAAVLLKLGEIEERRSEYEAAREHLTDSLEIARRLGDLQISARALRLLGVVALAQAEYVEGEANLKEALALAQEIGDTWIECAIETNIGWMERGLGYLDQATMRTKRALDLAVANHYTGHMAELELSLGVLDFLKKDYEHAKEHDLRGLHYAQELQDKRLQCGLHQALGGVEIALGNFEKAEDHLMKSLHLSVEIGHRWYNSVIWKEIGILRLKQQSPNAASSAFKRSLDLAREVHSRERVASALYGLARAAALQGNYAEARLQGLTSLNIYESIPHHPRIEVLKNWIESLSAMS